MIKAIDTASGVNYRFLLKDNVLKGIEILRFDLFRKFGIMS